MTRRDLWPFRRPQISHDRVFLGAHRARSGQGVYNIPRTSAVSGCVTPPGSQGIMCSRFKLEDIDFSEVTFS